MSDFLTGRSSPHQSRRTSSADSARYPPDPGEHRPRGPQQPQRPQHGPPGQPPQRRSGKQPYRAQPQGQGPLQRRGSETAQPARSSGTRPRPRGRRRAASPARAGVGPAGSPGGWSTVGAGTTVVVEEDLGDDPLVDPVYEADDRNWVRYRPMWGGFARLVLLVLIILTAVLWTRGRIYGWIDAQITPEGPHGGAVELTVPQGASVNEIAGELHSLEVISNATVFRYWLRCEGELTLVGFLGCDSVTPVEAGDYVLYENMDYESVKTVFEAGPLPEVFEIVRIPEGLRWSELSERLLEENPEFERDDLEAAYASLVSEASYLPEDAPLRSLEGMLFPANYDIAEKHLSDEQGFLLRLSDEFDKRFARLLEDPGVHEDVAEMGLTPYDMIIVASMIEEEALLAEDRPKIARVVYNRLAQGMRLEIDATSCYAAAKSCADLTSADLALHSPWNTRVVSGLPPTPISAPGEASLRAALQPADGDWLFYVLTDEDGVRGAHHFSETYEEHLRYVQVCRDLGYC